jgi:hypothetical protein
MKPATGGGGRDIDRDEPRGTRKKKKAKAE